LVGDEQPLIGDQSHSGRKEPRTVHHVLEMRGISKVFPGTLAVDNVDFLLGKSEIHALLGHNGAGKSTLMKILSGALEKDAGSILVRGQECRFGSPRDSIRAGIFMVYQELDLALNLPGFENIFLGDHEYRTPLGFVDKRRERREALRLIEKLGITDIDVRTPVGKLSISNQQIIAIAKAMRSNVDILVLDEPTSSLNSREIEILFSLLRSLKDSGVSIVFITHRLDEIFQIADAVSIMRDGRMILTTKIVSLKKEDVVRAIAPRTGSTDGRQAKERSTKGSVILEVKNLSFPERVKDVSFDVRECEVLGITGLMGCGATEVAKCIYGALPAQSGTIRYRGKDVSGQRPHRAVANGIGFVPENRKEEGLILSSPVRNNISLTVVKLLSRFGVISSAAERMTIDRALGQLQVKVTNARQNASTLSGGNQQKVVLAKWLARESGLLVLCEPTRGIDIGTKAEIQKKIRDLAESGLTILMVSSEIEEILAVSDRVIVMYEGVLRKELTGEELQKDTLVSAMYSADVGGSRGNASE
jgi:ribose transport system ATP-binding protein